MPQVSCFDRDDYATRCRYIPFHKAYRGYNEALEVTVRANGFLSFYDVYFATPIKSIRGAAMCMAMLRQLDYLRLDYPAYKASHRNQPLVYEINYELIAQTEIPSAPEPTAFERLHVLATSRGMSEEQLLSILLNNQLAA